MLELVHLCMKHNVPWYIENPPDSGLFDARPIRDLMHSEGISISRCDYCPFGTEYLKPTTILHWGNDHFASGAKTCKFGASINWICSTSGKRHVQLKGLDEHGKFRTAGASAYPKRLCDYWSKLIVDGFFNGDLCHAPPSDFGAPPPAGGGPCHECNLTPGGLVCLHRMCALLC